MKTILFFSNIYCFFSSLVFCDVKRNLVVFADFVHQSAYVDKHILLAFIVDDETETFPFIEKFYFTC